MSPRRRSGKKIDFVHWAFAQSDSNVSAGTAAVNMFAAQHEPETILRMRGNFMGRLPAGIASSVGADCGVGLILVPEGTGTTVLWSPITDGDAPWIWVDYFNVSYFEQVTDVIANPIPGAYRSTIDNKAMRIMRNQEMQVVFENVTNAGAVTVNFNIKVRALAGK